MSDSKMEVLTPIGGSDRERGLAYSKNRYELSETSIDGFFEKLERTTWKDGQGDTPLAKCMCALFLALDPSMEISKVMDALPRRGEPVDTLDILNALANAGYESREAKTTIGSIDTRLLPCLFTRVNANDNVEGYVVLEQSEPGRREQISVYDGQTGEIRKLADGDPLLNHDGAAHFCRKFGIEASELPKSTNPRFAEPTWFRKTLGRFRSTFWWLVAIGVVLNIVALATPVTVMLIYDRVISPQSLEPLPMLVLGLIGAITLEWRLRLLRSSVLSWLTARLDYVVGVSLFERLLMLSPSFVERAAVSAQVARIKTFESVRDFFSGPVFLAVLELPTVAISLLLIAYLAGVIVFVPIVIAVLYVAVFLAMRTLVKAAIREAATLTSITQQFSIETFEKMQAVRTQGLQSAWAAKYKQLSGREHVALARLHFLGAVGESLGHGLSVLAAVATLTIGVQMIWAGDFSVGALIATMILVFRALTPFYSLCQMIPRFEQTRNSVAQINELMDLEPEIRNEGASARLTKVEGMVAFRNVAMRYAREAGPVFYGLNALINPGEVVAIRGASGSGKSTILKLIQSMYAPYTGAIILDGMDIRQLAVRDVRRLVAYLPQEPHLLNGTIAENLRMVRPLADDQQIWEALRRAGAAQQVAALPDSINTRIETSDQIAADPALRHRIALARALVQKSAILLIDEIPNSLMAAGLGETIGDLIGEARGRQTMFYVTHRTDHARLADKIITLRPGSLATMESIHLLMEKSA